MIGKYRIDIQTSEGMSDEIICQTKSYDSIEAGQEALRKHQNAIEKHERDLELARDDMIENEANEAREAELSVKEDKELKI